MQEKGWPAHAYHTNKILLELKDRQQREKQAEKEKFNSIKRNVLRCWAWSQSLLQHGSPAHLGTLRKGIISTKSVAGKRTNFLLKELCLQGTEQHRGKNPKLLCIWNITELFPRVSGIPHYSKSNDRMIFHASYRSSSCTELSNVVISVAVSYYSENGICTTFVEALSLHKC